MAGKRAIIYAEDVCRPGLGWRHIQKTRADSSQSCLEPVPLWRPTRSALASPTNLPPLPLSNSPPGLGQKCKPRHRQSGRADTNGDQRRPHGTCCVGAFRTSLLNKPTHPPLFLRPSLFPAVDRPFFDEPPPFFDAQRLPMMGPTPKAFTSAHRLRLEMASITPTSG